MKKTILIIEDEPAYVRLLNSRLGFKYSTHNESEGKSGLLYALKKRPDLILLDLRLPIMDGLTVLKELRNDPDYGKDAKVILLTNLELAATHIADSIYHPLNHFVKSDINLDDLIKKIDNALT